MTFQESVMRGIEDLFHGNTLISISGKAGTGKSSLSLFLTGNFLTSVHPYEGSCIWIQASESFSKKRLNSLFRNDIEQLGYLTQNIFITPNHGPFTSYELQLEGLRNFTRNKHNYPPDLKFIVIDNISHHLRFKLSQISDVDQRSSLINRFYDMILTPLIFHCHREGITLIFIHEVSFDVKNQLTRPFFAKLYKRLRGVDIFLSKSLISSQRTMELEFNNTHISFIFKLTDKGFTFSK
ncbi:MAG: hypothetical protein ACW98X_07380 [Promethearchaeota archaeon]